MTIFYKSVVAHSLRTTAITNYLKNCLLASIKCRYYSIVDCIVLDTEHDFDPHLFK